MKIVLLASTVCVVISAQALATQPTPIAHSAVATSSTIVVPVQACSKGYHYGYCTNPKTGRKYRGCCPN